MTFEDEKKTIRESLSSRKPPTLGRQSSAGRVGKVTTELAKLLKTSDKELARGQVMQKGQKTAPLDGSVPVLWTTGAQGCIAVAIVGKSKCYVAHIDPSQLYSVGHADLADQSDTPLMRGLMDGLDSAVGLSGAEAHLASTAGLSMPYGKGLTKALKDRDTVQYRPTCTSHGSRREANNERISRRSCRPAQEDTSRNGVT
jgi:hypothetical protein